MKPVKAFVWLSPMNDNSCPVKDADGYYMVLPEREGSFCHEVIIRTAADDEAIVTSLQQERFERSKLEDRCARQSEALEDLEAERDKLLRENRALGSELFARQKKFERQSEALRVLAEYGQVIIEYLLDCDFTGERAKQHVAIETVKEALKVAAGGSMTDQKHYGLEDKLAMLRQLKEDFFCDMEGADADEFREAEDGYYFCGRILRMLEKGEK